MIARQSRVRGAREVRRGEVPLVVEGFAGCGQELVKHSEPGGVLEVRWVITCESQTEIIEWWERTWSASHVS